jgi:hypothetical protein
MNRRDLEDRDSSVVWLHHRGDEGDVSYRIGRRGSLVVAEWPGILSVTCGEDGSDLRVVPAPGASEDAVAKLRGVVKAFEGELRGGLGLHAAAVAVGSGAVLILGGSGAGKSTTAAELCLQHDGRLLADDVSLLLDVSGAVHVASTESHHYMTRASHEAVGLPWLEGAPSGRKVATLSPRSGDPGSVRVMLVAHLEVSDSGEMRCGRLRGVHAVQHILGSMLRFDPTNEVARRLELDRVVRLHEQAPFIEISRPADRSEAAQSILEALQGGNS